PSQSPAPAAGWWGKPRWPAVAWRAWLEQGVGFLVLWLVHLLGMNLLNGLERHSLEAIGPVEIESPQAGPIAVPRRVLVYRILIALPAPAAMTSRAAWLALSGGPPM